MDQDHPLCLCDSRHSFTLLQEWKRLEKLMCGKFSSQITCLATLTLSYILYLELSCNTLKYKGYKKCRLAVSPGELTVDW